MIRHNAKTYALCNLDSQQSMIFVREIAHKFPDFINAINYGVVHELIHCLADSLNEDYVHSLTVKLLGRYTEQYNKDPHKLDWDLIESNTEIREEKPLKT